MLKAAAKQRKWIATAGSGMEAGEIAPADSALWFSTTKNHNKSIGPLARPFARFLSPLTHLLTSHCCLRLCTPLRSFINSLSHSLTHSRACGKVNDWISQRQDILNHSTVGWRLKNQWRASWKLGHPWEEKGVDARKNLVMNWVGVN